MFNKELIPKNSRVIVGLSGGPDSVYLAHQLVRIKDEYNLAIIAAHLDHEWRSESGNDVLFCKNLCEQLGIAFVSKKASELSSSFKYNGSKEEVGRKLRRYFFESLQEEYNASAIILGHHQDDQFETFFIRLIRGTTVSGLTGIQEQSSCYLRPLLSVSKKSILLYLQKNKIDFLHDATNDSNDFLRNRIRNNLIPVLEKCDSRAKNNTIRIMNQLQETEEYLQQETNKQYKRIFEDTIMNISLFQKLCVFMQKRIITQWICQDAQDFILTETFIIEILRFLTHPHNPSHKKTHQLTNQWVIFKYSNKALLQLTKTT